jgi:uncharacterized protein YkwD
MLDRKMLLVTVPFFLLVGCGQAETYETTTTPDNTTEVTAVLKGEGERLLDALNQARSVARDCHDGAGIVGPSRPLRWNNELYAAAYEHSYDLAMSDTFSHYGSGTEWDVTGSNNGGRSYFYERIESNGYGEYRTLGENVAGGQRSVEEVMEAWLASPGHCANIMNDDFSEVGIAVVTEEDSSFGIYWTQNFGSK